MEPFGTFAEYPPDAMGWIGNDLGARLREVHETRGRFYLTNITERGGRRKMLTVVIIFGVYCVIAACVCYALLRQDDIDKQ